MREIKLTGPLLRELYNDVGQEAGLERILKAFYQAMRTDMLIGFFFDGKDVDAIALKQKAFLMRAWGASASYTGEPPATAHKALPPILSGHFDRRLRLLESTLRDFGVSDENVKTWVQFENSFRPAVQSDAR